MATFALVLGAWHGGWCWDLLVGELTRRGHRCVAPDLPFDDPTATWDAYAEVIADALARVDDPVLVGHSGGALTIPLVALRRPVKLLVYLCPSTPVATPRPDSPPSLQEGAWDAVKTDELGRSWWQPEDAVQGMYRHLDPALATWAAGRLRHDADPGPYPLEAPPRLSSLYIYATDDEFFTPSLVAGPPGTSSASSRSASKAATSRCSRDRQNLQTSSSRTWNRATTAGTRRSQDLPPKAV